MDCVFSMVRFALAVSLIPAAWTAAVAGSPIFNVQQWQLGTGVTGTPPNVGVELNQTVTNPLILTQHWDGTDGFSSSETSYRFGWDSSFGDFLVQVTHRAADVDPNTLRSGSSGLIYFTSNTDVLFTIDGNYSYSLPINPMLTIFNLSVSDAQPPHDSPIGFGNYYGTEDGAPASGSFPISGQAVLPAGHTWLIDYLMEVETLGGLSGQIASGDGYLHFTLQSVPAPAAFLPLALAALLLRKRRGCR